MLNRRTPATGSATARPTEEYIVQDEVPLERTLEGKSVISSDGILHSLEDISVGAGPVNTQVLRHHPPHGHTGSSRGHRPPDTCHRRHITLLFK